jgi:hypothetical protein
MKSIRKFSLLRSVVLALLAACLSAGLASARNSNAQSTAAFAGYYSFTLDRFGPNPAPPDPCSTWRWVKSVLQTVEAFF